MSKFAVLSPCGIYYEATDVHNYPFDTFEKADAYAKEAARLYPGQTVRIAVIVADVVAPVMPPQTVRTLAGVGYG